MSNMPLNLHFSIGHHGSCMDDESERKETRDGVISEALEILQRQAGYWQEGKRWPQGWNGKARKRDLEAMESTSLAFQLTCQVKKRMNKGGKRRYNMDSINFLDLKHYKITMHNGLLCGKVVL